MAKIDLSKYGITGTTEVVYNPSYELLFEEETKPELEGFEKGQESELGAVNVMTGVYTGRSPKDKFIVMDENSKDTVWWTSDEYKNDNHPTAPSFGTSLQEYPAPLGQPGPLVKWLRHRPFTAVTRVRVPYGSPIYGGVAQPVEHLLHTQGVTDSSSVVSTIKGHP